MARGARKRAARYSELSKSGKRKQRNRTSATAGAAPVPVSQEVREVPEATRAKAPAVKTTPRVQPGLKRAVSGYDYVRADLKRIGLLSGLMVVIVVVLAFTLG